MRKNKRHYNKNRHHQKSNMAVIAWSYFFSGANLLCAGFHAVKTTDDSIPKVLILLGVVMFLMVPISILDDRVEMRSKSSAVSVCVLNLLFCCMLSCLFSYLWIIVYVCEIVWCLFTIAVMRMFFN